MVTNTFSMGRSSNGEKGIGMAGDTNNILRDLAKIEKSNNVEDLNQVISTSGLGDPFFGVDEISTPAELKKFQAYASGMIDIINKDKLSLKKFVKTNKTVQKGLDYVKNPGKAFGDFRSAVDNPGNTDDILSKPFR